MSPHVRPINKMGNPFTDNITELLARNVIDNSAVNTVSKVEVIGKEQ